MISHEYLEQIPALNDVERAIRAERMEADVKIELEEQRRVIMAGLPTALVSHHESLARDGPDSVVALQAGGACGGCEEKLPVAILAELSHPGRIGVCPRCGRFVFKPRKDRGTDREVRP